MSEYIKKESVGKILREFETDTNDVLIGDIAQAIDNLPTFEIPGWIPQWHDLRENPDDLPEKTSEYFVLDEFRRYSVTTYNIVYGWSEPYRIDEYASAKVVKWCELTMDED